MEILANSLCKSFVMDGKPLSVLDNLNVTIPEGQFACLLGPSGCGKSTFLRCIAGLETVSAGTLHFGGRPIAGPGPDRSMVFQDYALFAWYTIEENIRFGLELRHNKALKGRLVDGTIEKLIRLVGLTGFERAYPHHLSGGMRQRAAIARALAVDPGALLMDEPFAAVDAITRESLQKEIVDIWAQTRKTIVFVTHSVAEAVYLGEMVHVFGTRPASIRASIPIDLPRPRNPADPRFGATVELLRSEIDKGFGERIAA